MWISESLKTWKWSNQVRTKLHILNILLVPATTGGCLGKSKNRWRSQSGLALNIGHVMILSQSPLSNMVGFNLEASGSWALLWIPPDLKHGPTSCDVKASIPASKQRGEEGYSWISHRGGIPFKLSSCTQVLESLDKSEPSQLFPNLRCQET